MGDIPVPNRVHDCNVGKTSFPREGIELPYLVQLGGSNDDVSSARCSRCYEVDIHSQKRAVSTREWSSVAYR